MSQVRPHSSMPFPHVCIDNFICSSSSTHFTVWKKSMLLNGKGFTVFDSLGDVVFRVDNYASNVKKEVVLMDDTGQLLLTMRRKKWGFRKRWEAFRGDPVESDRPKFSLAKCLGFSNKSTANVFVDGSRQTGHCDYEIKGLLWKPACTIFSACGEIIAQVKRKEARPGIMLGNDVFSMVVEAGVDQAFVMGLLIMFNQRGTADCFRHYQILLQKHVRMSLETDGNSMTHFWHPSALRCRLLRRTCQRYRLNSDDQILKQI